MALPRSALLSLWLRAGRLGIVGPDDAAEAVAGEDPRHLVVGWPGAEEPFGLEALPAALRRFGVVGLHVAVPASGDPVGLCGPPAFNTLALDAGEALILAGSPHVPSMGLVPRLDARTVVWQAFAAERPPLIDPGEAARALRQTLVGATNDLVRLDVASWQPEIPDLLLNLRHRPPLALPPGTPPEAVDALERAVLCREIVALALNDDGGAVSAYEMAQRRGCLTELDRAARRAIAAWCSDSLLAS